MDVYIFYSHVIIMLININVSILWWLQCYFEKVVLSRYMLRDQSFGPGKLVLLITVMLLASSPEARNSFDKCVTWRWIVDSHQIPSGHLHMECQKWFLLLKVLGRDKSHTLAHLRILVRVNGPYIILGLLHTFVLTMCHILNAKIS